MNNEAKLELEVIRRANNGILRPKDVVTAAASKNSALHPFFEWDDTVASEKFREAQARALIKVAVHVSPHTSEKIKAYVSLSADRRAGGGYRATADVLNDEVLTEIMLADAAKELAAFSRKYNHLKNEAAFCGLFETIEEAVHKIIQPGEIQLSA